MITWLMQKRRNHTRNIIAVKRLKKKLKSKQQAVMAVQVVLAV
jgi:hypothetical protein